ncbi:DUF2249 domain-containing protein [Roseateles puraquae]|jgi:uncharacterized protein (DUF2249 family)|uniref:DUF2249 domain-containing protein n=1 Tax=Roseateles puraquae TaxID=431059 RepID=UPI0031DB02A0
MAELCLQGLDDCAAHERLLARFDALPLGHSLDLLAADDPQPLFFQLASARPGQFDWRYLEQGPTLWRVRLLRLAEAPPRPCQESCPCSLRGDR